ncbi:MAG: nucleotidyltransferase substrate binding protein [Mongoliitalea sp.]
MKLNSSTTYAPHAKFQEALAELNDYTRTSDFKNSDVKKYRKQVIRLFEITHEQALLTMEEFFRKQGKGPFSGSRDLTVEAFHADLIDDGKGWLDMVIDRIKFNPVYPEDHDAELAEKIIQQYIKLMDNFDRKFTKI